MTRPAGGAPVRVDWRVRRMSGAFKITDVVVEGVSMSITQRDEFSAVIQLFRKGDPQLPCLVMAPLDHGERDGSGKIVTRPIVPKLVQAQREVAEAEGCAFFDTYEAMGGSGSMGRWVRSSPALGSGDLSHLTHHGHKVVGAMLYRSLMQGYADYRKRIAGTAVKALTGD